MIFLAILYAVIAIVIALAVASHTNATDFDYGDDPGSLVASGLIGVCFGFLWPLFIPLLLIAGFAKFAKMVFRF